MEIKKTAAKIEAILFASGDPVPEGRLREACGLPHEQVEDALKYLENEKSGEGSGICLVRMNGKAQLCTKPEQAEAVRGALETRRPPALSQAAMEALSIIAYRQPVTKSYVEQVRGVDSGYTVSSLSEKGLVEECGRLDVPGRPILYRTTDLFLRTFGLASLAELPKLAPGEDGQLPLLEEMPAEGPEEEG